MSNWSEASGFGDSGGESDPDWVPTGLRGLDNGVSKKDLGEDLNQSIRGPKIYSSFQDNLESGWGREKLFKYVDNNLDDYSADETVDLKLYLLDRIDSSDGYGEGVLLGGNVFDFIVDFVNSDGEPDFLDDYEVDLGYED